MEKDTGISFQFSPITSFKDFMYNTVLGRVLITTMIGGSLFTGYQIMDNYLIKKSEPIVQQQVLSGEKPEIYIERDGVKYFSHVDGKEISDLVNQ